MGKLILVACTNVGRYIIEEILNNSEIKTQLSGIINLNTKQGINKANYDSYADLQLKYGLDIKYCNNVNDEEILEWLEEKDPDIILQSGWSQKFGERLLNIPKYGCIGEHPAPLPKGRGAACVNWAILTGEKQWGDSFFQMVEEYDKGCIYAQEFFNIENYDSVFTVYEKVAESSAKIVRENIDKWTEGCFNAIKQDDRKATYYKKRRPSDGEIKDFMLTATDLHNFIRAQAYPYPCAYVMYKGRKIKLLESRVLNCKCELPCGTVERYLPDTGSIAISCGEGTALEIIRLQEEGRPSSWALHWAEQNNIKNEKLI